MKNIKITLLLIIFISLSFGGFAQTSYKKTYSFKGSTSKIPIKFELKLEPIKQENEVPIKDKIIIFYINAY